MMSKEKKNNLEKGNEKSYKLENKSYVLPQREKIQSLTGDASKSTAQ